MHLIGTDGSYRRTTNKASWATSYNGTDRVDLVDHYRITGITPELAIIYDLTQPCPATNNRGELLAILVAVQIIENSIPVGEKVEIVSDSEYCIKTLTVWYNNWVEKGLLGSKLNIDIISIIMGKINQLTSSGHVIKFCKVKSHTKDYANLPDRKYYEINDIVDKLAQAHTL